MRMDKQKTDPLLRGVYFMEGDRPYKDLIVVDEFNVLLSLDQINFHLKNFDFYTYM